MHRTETGTERPYSWWLHFPGGDATIAADYVKSHATKVEDIMTSEVITAPPETPLHEVATKLEEHGIKRVQRHADHQRTSGAPR
ncbi:CBS domain-containing protein [Bradyrhizobium sp.]|uniref:CBS domain-containing protein n=1 Tax=Bradyrhizobium sp. TaxID=376 RepID=UPI00343389D2